MLWAGQSLAKPRLLAPKKLQRVDLKSDVRNRFPAKLSGEMRKNVNLVRVIAADLEIIFLWNCFEK